MKRILLAFIAALFLGACASAPDRNPPDIDVEAPGLWTAAESADTSATPVDWWREFADTTLDSVITEALDNNLDIHAAAARLDQALALAKVASADLWPQLNAGAQAGRQRQNIIGIPIGGDDAVITSRQSTFGVSMNAAWEIDLWGRIRKGHAAALADAEATAADLAAIRLSIAAQTAKSWFAVAEAHSQVELAKATVESFQQSADQVQRRYQEGVRTSLDLRLSRSALASARALLALREQQFDASKRRMEILLGRYPSGNVQTTLELPSVEAGVPSSLPSELLIRRPDLIAAERRFAAAESRVSQSRRAFFPRISLTGLAGTLGTQLQHITDLDFGIWSIAAGLTQPIFQGGRLRANLRASHAVSDQALVAYVQSLLIAFGEVELALVAENALADQESNLAEAAYQSEAARLLAERQYNAGLVDYITVLETQRQSLNSQIDLLTVRRQRLDARINLHLSLGGGFELTEDWTQFLDTRTTHNGGSR